MLSVGRTFLSDAVRIEPASKQDGQEYPSYGVYILLFVIASIELNPGTRDNFLREFRYIVQLVRAEAGCIEYGPTIDATTDLPVQGPARADSVTVVEKWESLEHLKAHMVAPHMMEYRPRVKDFVRSVKLQILEPV